jgi:hypothetical protein
MSAIASCLGEFHAPSPVIDATTVAICPTRLFGSHNDAAMSAGESPCWYNRDNSMQASDTIEFMDVPTLNDEQNTSAGFR